jgi:hypothetical protein
MSIDANFSTACATVASRISSDDVISSGSKNAPRCSRSAILATLLAVATTLSPWASAAIAISLPRPVEQPVMSHVRLLEVVVDMLI